MAITPKASQIIPQDAGNGAQGHPPVLSRIHALTGREGAPILIVCDAMMQSDRKAMMAWSQGQPMSEDAHQLVGMIASQHGFNRDDFQFVRLCPPMAEIDRSSEKRKWAHVEPHVETLKAVVEQAKPKMVITMGELASRAMLGRSIKITKARGSVEVKDGLPIMPMLSPGYVLRIPEHRPTFASDFLTLSKLKQNGWSTDGMVKIETDYQWRADISDLIDAGFPQVIATDTETTGLKWYRDEVWPFLWQFSPKPGQSFLVPIHEAYWEKVFPGIPFSQMEEAKRQMAHVVEDRGVRMIGQNLKFDHHMKRKIMVQRADGSVSPMQPRGWMYDTEVMAFQVDENMIQKNLDECIRRWVPDMAGYADAFNSVIDKSKMLEVPPDVMLPYAGGDPDAVIRLARVLRDILKKDPRQMNVMNRVQMGALMMFAQVTEPAGVLIDQEKLASFGEEVRAHTQEEYRWLIRQVPAAVRRRHMAAAMEHKGKKQSEALEKALSFTRPDFTRDVLFSKDGLGLKPVVFTDSTKALAPDKREPSTSAKDHFPYFVTHKRHGDFVLRLGEFMKAKHMSSTYIGDREEGNGFWQYIGPDGCIHPSFSLTRTNTGRTASNDPNGQNFPKRGRWAKAYQEIFIPRPGKAFAASDLSQIELRLIAWMANEPAMMAVYRAGGDIHATTAAAALGISDAQFAELESTLRKLQRFRAKAVNFGFCYGAQSETFRTYAKTDYGVDYTEDEAVTVRERYFAKYRGLTAWHDFMREQVRKHGFVRAMHGSVRHLPSIWSQDRKIVSGTERQAINAPIQRMGSDLCLIGALRFQSQVHPDIARVVLTVHDQVVLECEEGYEEAMIRVLCWAMQNPPLEEWFGVTSPIPFGSDAEISRESLGKMEERTDLTAAKPLWWNDDEKSVLTGFMMGDPLWSFVPGMSREDAETSLVRVRV